MEAISQEKLENLLSVEATIVNIYQQLSYLEKEQRGGGTNLYHKSIVCLEQSRKVEKNMIKEIYNTYGIDSIVKVFSNVFVEDIMGAILTLKPLNLYYRIINSFLECYYEDFACLNESQNSASLLRRESFILENIVLLHLEQIIQKHIHCNFYKEVFTDLKYNFAFSYPFLEEAMLKGNFETLTKSNSINYFSFIYNINSKKLTNDLEFLAIQQIGIIIEQILALHSSELDVRFEILSATLKSYLLSINNLTLGYLECIICENKKEKPLVDKILAIFSEVRDLKLFQVERNLGIPSDTYAIEFNKR